MPRRPRNLRPDLNGLLVIDKPIGMSSASVCRAVRRATGGAKVGHAGTLDPLATGVLLVCLGRATRAVETLMAGEKTYVAEIDLSAFTTTDDREGERIEVAADRTPTRADLERACAGFVGAILQSPPAYSAVHVDGERAYRLARRGELSTQDIGAALPERPVTVHSIEIIDFDWPYAAIRVNCGKGTYIRSLARDIGRALGTGGHLSALRRTRVGGYMIDDAVPLAAIEPFDPALIRPIFDE